jgi:two-component system KDP operon response regulator KdpE
MTRLRVRSSTLPSTKGPARTRCSRPAACASISAAGQVWVGDSEVHLTPLQYKLLAALVRHAGQVRTHHRLLQEVWGPNVTDHTHYLRVYMAQLRHKLERDPARPRLLLTESGVGYRLNADR